MFAPTRPATMQVADAAETASHGNIRMLMDIDPSGLVADLPEDLLHGLVHQVVFILDISADAADRELSVFRFVEFECVVKLKAAPKVSNPAPIFALVAGTRTLSMLFLR